MQVTPVRTPQTQTQAHSGSELTDDLKVVSVVIPVYYNEGSLSRLYEELAAVDRQLTEREARLELIFVDDGSGDGSMSELLKIKDRRPDTKIVKLTRNFGAMAAVKTGLRFVCGHCVVLLAADLQDPPELITTMVDRWLAGSKYVLCVRAGRSDPARSVLFSRVYYKLLRMTVIPDYPSGGYDVALMDKVFLPYLLHSGKNINVPLFAYWLGFSPSIIEYHRRERVHGVSRWTWSKRVKFFVDSMVGFSIVPIRLMSVLGLTVSCAGVAYGALVVGSAVFGRTSVRGFPSLASLISFLLGVVILMLGVIGEYVWRIFDQVNLRPEAVIEDVRL